MRKDISIFIAGSTDETREERECLKVLANDLSSEYRALGLRVNAMSYRNFDDNQERYNSFIEDEADIVFFVLKGEMGDKTQEEFMTAAKAWREKNLPEIVVFLFGPSTKDSIKTGKIYGLMEALLNRQYPVRYDTLDELRAEAKLRIDRHIQKRKKEPEDKTSVAEVVLKEAPKSQTEAAPVVSSSSRRWLMWLLGAAILILGGFIVWQNFLPQPQRLLFAGGGSVKNFLMCSYDVDVDNYDNNSIYANMGSGVAWNLLYEEYNRFLKFNKDEKMMKYLTVCLSADMIDSLFVKERCSQKGFLDDVRILGYYLGEDPLVVYVKNDLLKDWKINEKDSVISASDLSLKLNEMAKKSEIGKIFSTSKNSGTQRLYQSCFVGKDTLAMDSLIDKEVIAVFNENSDPQYINGNNNRSYVLLGSRYYTANKLKKEYRGLKVEKDGKIVTKPMYIYILTFNHNPYKVGKPIFDFLEDIQADKRIMPEVWEELKEGEIKPSNQQHILELELRDEYKNPRLK